MTQHELPRDDANGIERVLKNVGPRAQPPAHVEAAARASAHSAWREVVAQRRQRRQRWVTFGAAAGVAALASAVWVGTIAQPPELRATHVARTTGEVMVQQGTLPLWRSLDETTSLRQGARIRTGADGMLAMDVDGLSVRLNNATQIELSAPRTLVADAGAVYVDAGPGVGAGSPLDIITADATVRHVGTQYEVRLTPQGTRVRVREGRIELVRQSGAVELGGAGEQLYVASGSVERSAVEVHGPDWDWIQAVAPPIAIDGRPLTEFLAWTARELGRPVEFADAQSEAEAARTMLSGTVQGMSPRQALAAVVSTTRLRVVERGDRLIVEMPAGT